MPTIPEPADNFEDRVAKAGDYAKAWVFDEDGPLITGELLRTDERKSEFGELYPILTLKRANGEARSVHCFETALQAQVGRANPAVGERVGIRRHEEKKQSKIPGRGPYYPYTAVVEGREGGSVNLKKYAGSAEQPVHDGEVTELEERGQSQADEQAERDARDARLDTPPF
jgi:hypothetical protein